jgi:hypothetical protein
MTRYICYLQLRRDDPRWSAIGNGDELVVAATTSREAAEAVKRLFAGERVEVWPAQQQREFFC